MKTSAAQKPRRTVDRSAPVSTRYYTTSKLSENIHETPEGYLLCIGVPLAGIGEMEYGEGETPLEVGDDGKVVVTRSADVLFAPETIASFEGKAVTIRHPTDFLNPSNWGRLANGIMQNVRRGDGEHETDLLADLLITAEQAIALVKRGLREVSLGYDAWYVQTGIGRGVQTKIIGNHLALVEEGRAGAGYAITDHKGKGSAMKMKDRIKAIFAKAQDEALQVAEETGDDDVEETAGDLKSLAKTVDGLSRVVVKLNDKIDRAVKGKSKDASTQPTAMEPAKVEAKDDETGLADRLTVLEGKVEKLLAMLADKTGDDDTESDEETDDEMCEDDDGEGDDDEVTDGDSDDDEEPKKKTGDSRGPKEGDDDDEEELAARVEILAPGMSVRSKNVKAKALLAAYSTKDGKAVIEQFTHGKKLDVKNAKFVNTVFIAASEILKSKRTRDFANTRTSDFQSSMGQPKGAMTPEEVNERNAKHYGPKTTH